MPWETQPGGPTLYLETGRQVLGLIADREGSSGIRTVLLPAHFCESMAQPFAERGWRILLLPLKPDLRFDLAACREVLAALNGPALAVIMSFFGSQPDVAHRRLAKELREQSVVVVEDETHRVFRPGGAVDADYYFGSMRKLLPVADGAYLRGLEGTIRDSIARGIGAGARWSPMDEKLGDLEADRPSTAGLFRSANAELESSIEPRTASVRTLNTIQRMDFEWMVARRIENQAELLTGLRSWGDLQVVSEASPSVPSHLVVSVPNPGELQRRLSDHRIYCPIHWPRPSFIDDAEPWREDLISLPVDHRYGPADMRRLSDAIRVAIA
ncbi:hypothetical protein [Orlajensenia leifsoniae]|uniref:DegT/DnrJ/EryC1/StrS aminotransferase family protein n=1 Tax=Orlajensenia leifsoniae TaxID=2561933 RepID=A0A4Y9QYW1_9MICO|nr:hypothetical protein [Leifsonia flava]TFV96948.1 hypothetical protein E4M00_12895 [Leifsonia flava]